MGGRSRHEDMRTSWADTVSASRRISSLGHARALPRTREVRDTTLSRPCHDPVTDRDPVTALSRTCPARSGTRPCHGQGRGRFPCCCSTRAARPPRAGRRPNGFAGSGSPRPEGAAAARPGPRGRVAALRSVENRARFCENSRAAEILGRSRGRIAASEPLPPIVDRW